LHEEIDYEHEAHNAETFADNFADDPKVRVPKVVWSHTTRRVLTLEDVWAIKITDYQAITQAGISGRRLLVDCSIHICSKSLKIHFSTLIPTLEIFL